MRHHPWPFLCINSFLQAESAKILKCEQSLNTNGIVGGMRHHSLSFLYYWCWYEHHPSLFLYYMIL